jgi:hypothetical protein
MRGALPMLLYMLEVGLAGDKIGNHPNRPLHAAMQPPERGGAERAWGWCNAPKVRPLLGLARLPPPCSGRLLAGPRWLPHRCLAQVCCVGMLSPFIPLCIFALCFSELRLLMCFLHISCICPKND